MPWSSGLRPEVIRELKERHPGLTLDEIAIEAAQRSEYADEFDRLDVRPYTGSEGFRMVFLCSPRRIPKMAVPVENAADFRDLVVVMLAGGSVSAEMDDLIGGNPYLKADYEEAGKLHHKNKMTIQGIEARRELKRKRAYRIYRQFKEGAVLYDEVGLRPGPGYRWDLIELDNDPPRYKLIRR